jgi:predicted ATPase
MAQLSLHLPAAEPRDREPFLRRVTIVNFKSIGKCDVKLSRLTVLVGRNGAGQSNFLDALRFVTDGLQSSLDHAIKSRGGIASVRRRSTGHPRNFAIKVEFGTPDAGVATYGFEIAARTDGAFSVKAEQLEMKGPAGEMVAHYRIRDGEVDRASQPTMPRAVADRLYLVVASGIPEFRIAYDALTSMGFYNLNPESMKELQSPDAGELLHRDGDNIASVIARLDAEAPEEKRRAEQYLGKIVDGIVRVNRVPLGPRETIEFAQQVTGAKYPWQFFAANMSDGTLRALGILIAVSQLVHIRDRVRMVGIEEPETALHPAAARALMDALNEATEHTQVLLTTHSADLLDAMDAGDEGLLAVVARQGETIIAPIDAASRNSIREHLYNAGELLRMDQLEPDLADVKRQETTPLFEGFAEVQP